MYNYCLKPFYFSGETIEPIVKPETMANKNAPHFLTINHVPVPLVLTNRTKENLNYELDRILKKHKR